MSASDLFLNVGSPGSATTLDANYTAGGTSITVVSTTNWTATGEGVIFAMDEATVVDGQEVQTPGTYNEFEGTVASATSITNVDQKRGSGDRNYTAGSLTRVYIPVSAERENRLAEGMLVAHDQDGTLKAGAVDVAAVLASDVVTTAKIADGAVTPIKQSGNLVYAVRLTGGASSGVTPLLLGSITIPSQPFAYYLDVTLHWTGNNDVADDQFLLRVRDGASASGGTTHAHLSNRHIGSANFRMAYSIGGVVTEADVTSTPLEVAISTAKTINAGITRTIGTGTIDTQDTGVMYARVIPK